MPKYTLFYASMSNEPYESISFIDNWLLYQVSIIYPFMKTYASFMIQ